MIKLYSTQCPKCNILEAKLKEKGVNYKLITDADIMMSKGFLSSPMLEVDEVTMDYYTAIKWINERT